MKKLSSINKRLVTLQSTILFVTLLGVIIVGLFIGKVHFINFQQRYMSHITSDINSDIAHQISITKERILIMGSDMALEHYIDNYQEALLENFLHHYKDVLPVISYIDKNGTVIKKMLKGEFLDNTCNFHKRPIYKKTMQNPNQVVVSPIRYNTLLKTYVFEFALQKVGYFGDEFQGIIAGIVPLHDLIEHDEFQDDKKLIVRLIGKNGEIQFSTISKEIASNVTIQDDTKKTISNFLNNPKEELHEMTINGVDGYTYSLPLFDNNSILLITYSYDDFMEVLFKQFKWILAIFIIALLIALITTYRLSLKITKPLKALTNAIGVISKGDYTKHINIKTGDEIEELSHHFNNMNDQLEAIKREVDKKTDELEQKVQDRTKRLEQKLYVDDLTGLASRYAFLKALSLCGHQHTAIIFLIDIDSFQTYNKIYGTNIGNEILIEFSHLLTQFSQNSNYSLYRISGDEFALYEMVDAIDTDRYEMTLESLFTFVKENRIYIQSINEYVDLNITVGVAFSNKNPLGKADMALHEAKKQGKNFATYTMHTDTTLELQNTLHWKREIQNALEQDRVIPYFQPIVNRNQEVIKYEALIRIKQYDKNGKEEIISPFHFMSIAMQTKQYSALSYTVIDKALTAIKEKNVSLSINMDMHDFNNRELTTMLKKHIVEFNRFNQENGTPLNYIALEILEDEAIKDYESFARQLEKFKDIGAFIAIDDFGSGYSNLSHIIGMSPRYLKIDATLIKNIATDEHSYKIVESVVQFAKALGIQTIAEYVASKEIFDIVYEIGIDEFQGYYFGKPVAIDEI